MSIDADADEDSGAALKAPADAVTAHEAVTAGGSGPVSVRSGGSIPSDAGASEIEFAGWGTVEQIDNLGSEPIEVTRLDSGPHKKLGELASTAICGNDITSSCLYVAALCSVKAGPYAFLCLAAVGGMLYLFRKIYAEVGTALPLNGGAYNALLNTTSKFKASMAACLTMLSYLATAVISAYEAMKYLWHFFPVSDGLVGAERVEAVSAQQGFILWATLGLLGFFALLNLVGITESAKVAIGIFVVHIATLLLLIGFSLVKFGFSFDILVANWRLGPPAGSTLASALIFGFAAGLLGISGFESSANFIEEQEPKVFPKTLRNMWIAVMLFNPLISFLAMCIMPLADVTEVVNGVVEPREDFLAHMGEVSAGPWLAKLVSIDAVAVLSGAVLTAYVGVTGLVRRMALDRCLPQFLLAENRTRRTNHWIILGFWFLSGSMLFMARENPLELLAGVYAISFLCVMALFAVGNMLLKIKRKRLPRAVRASWPGVILAFILVTIGLVANSLIDYPTRLQVFILYFGVSVAVVALTFLRGGLLRVAIAVMKAIIDPISRRLEARLEEVNNQLVVFFTKGDNRANLNRAALYVIENEQTKRLKVVHVYRDWDAVDNDRLAEQLSILDKTYPELRIDLVLVKGHFGPELIERLSRKLGVPKNYMFLGTPGDRFPHNIAELGGVRLII